MWASGLSAEMNFGHISAKQKGMHIGTAAVFMVADCLLHCHLKQRVLACLEISIDFLLSWLFLDGNNFGRKPEGALQALAGLFVANGMAILKGRARTQQSHQVGQLLCPDHRSIFWPKSFPEQSLAQKRQAIDQFVHLQLLAVRAPNIDLEAYGCNLQNCAVLYQWLGPSRYVGVASLQRASRPGMPGPALRWWEHLLHWSRRSLKGSQLKKYVLFRKASGSNMVSWFQELALRPWCMLLRLSYLFAHLHLLSSETFSSLIFSLLLFSSLWLFPSLLFICPYCRKFDF